MYASVVRPDHMTSTFLGFLFGITGLWLLTAKSVLNKETYLDMSVHFGYIDKEQPGDSLKASDLIKPDTWHSHGEEVSIQSLQ